MKKLLIIDDSEVNLYLIESVFEQNTDIEVIIESQSTQAYDKIIAVKPDLILLDLMMPNIDGFQLLQQIRETPEIADIAIVIISAKTDDETVNKVKEYGVKNFIKKPINLEKIELMIRELLGLF